MFLVEPNRTPYDLNFRLGDIPVRVHPFFWILTIVLGWDTLRLGFGFLLLWVACVFVSILVHELGHVLMGRLFGTAAHIVLYSFGGLAVGSSTQASRWKRIAVYFAGPLAGFVLFGVALAAGLFFLAGWVAPLRLHGLMPYLFIPRDPGTAAMYASDALNDLLEINLFWGLLNLLPILPLDGGQISRDFLTGVMPQRGLRTALGISVVVAGLLAVNALSVEFRHKPLVPYLDLGGIYTAILFGLLALSSFMQLQQTPQQPPRRQWDRDEEERSPWERDPDYWKKGRDPWND